VKCPRPIKVLQIVDTLGMGGAETWLMELLRLWSQTNVCHLDFLATSGSHGIFDEEARRLGARLHYVRYGRTHLPRFASEFRGLLRKGKYDAIHDHQDYASGWHFLMGTGVLPPVRMTHVHNPSYQILNNYGVTLSRRLTAQVGKKLVGHYATHITGTSRQVISEYGFDDSGFSCIPKAAVHCGFDATRFLGDISVAKASIGREFGWLDDVKVILFVGRIDESANFDHPRNHKNSAFAVSVGIESCQKHPHVRMLLAGALSPAVPSLEERIAGVGLRERIRFLGIREDVERLMLGSDVLLFPSRGEGLGMAAVEAQAAGLPVLASDAVPRECEVIPELVRFKGVDAGPEAWANELLQMADQPRDIVAANQQVAESAFSIHQSAWALLQLYRQGAVA
jgi:glycosyltransferase involved in cell wall biosynthesis